MKDQASDDIIIEVPKKWRLAQMTSAPELTEDNLSFHINIIAFIESALGVGRGGVSILWLLTLIFDWLLITLSSLPYMVTKSLIGCPWRYAYFLMWLQTYFLIWSHCFSLAINYIIRTITLESGLLRNVSQYDSIPFTTPVTPLTSHLLWQSVCKLKTTAGV